MNFDNLDREFRRRYTRGVYAIEGLIPAREKAIAYGKGATFALGAAYLRNRVSQAITGTANKYLRKALNQEYEKELESIEAEVQADLNDPSNPYSFDFGPQTRPPTTALVEAPPRHSLTPARTYPEMPKVNKQPGEVLYNKKQRLARAAAFKEAYNPAIRQFMSKASWKSQYSVPRNAGLHGEVKSVDVTNTFYNVPLYNGTNQGICLNGTQVGSAFQNRIGQKIAMNTLYAHMNIYPSGSGSSVGGIMRIMIVYDRAPNGAAATLGDVLQTVTQAGTASVTMYSGINLANRERFRVYADKRISLPACPAFTQGPYPVTVPAATIAMNVNGSHGPLEQFIFLNRAESVYAGTAGTVGDLKTGALLMFVFTDATILANAAASGWYCDYETRLRFTDS